MVEQNKTADEKRKEEIKEQETTEGDTCVAWGNIHA